jgi:hypothetical protein
MSLPFATAPATPPVLEGPDGAELGAGADTGSRGCGGGSSGGGVSGAGSLSGGKPHGGSPPGLCDEGGQALPLPGSPDACVAISPTKPTASSEASAATRILAALARVREIPRG